MPKGGTALRSMATRNVGQAVRADLGNSTTPAAPAATTSVRSAIAASNSPAADTAGGHVTAADEKRRAGQILRPTREDGPVYHVAHLLRPDVAVAEHFVGAGVDGDDAVEDAGLRVGIELDQDFPFVHDGGLRTICF